VWGGRGGLVLVLAGGSAPVRRDKVWCVADAGAWCLSWLGDRASTEDKHKAPSPLHHRPLSLRKGAASTEDKHQAPSPLHHHTLSLRAGCFVQIDIAGADIDFQDG